MENILPVNPDVPNFPQLYDKQEHVLNTNKLIQQVAEDTQCTYVNIHDLFTDTQGRLDEKYSKDGLHPAPGGGGFEMWVAYLRKLGFL